MHWLSFPIVYAIAILGLLFCPTDDPEDEELEIPPMWRN